MYIKELSSKLEEIVTLKGWVANKRESKGLVFIILRDGTGLCQCIVDANLVDKTVFENAQKLSLESSLAITGKVVKDERQVGGYELQTIQLAIYQIAEEYPISKKEHGVDFLMDNRHLWLRSNRQWAIMRIRNGIIFSIHQFLQAEGFVQMDAPIFTGNACEGTSNLFESDYYGEPAYLSQSGQLYGEAMAMAMGKIYTFGPTFRAEKSKTRRHLTEFWMIEPEMAFYDIFDNMDLIERFLKFVINNVIQNYETELLLIGRDIEKLKNATLNFKRLTYTEAVDIITGKVEVNGLQTINVLKQDLAEKEIEKANITKEIDERTKKIAVQGIKKGEINFNLQKIAELKNKLKDIEEDLRNIPEWINSAQDFEYGNDFGGSDETVLTRMFETPIMVYDWPHEVKAFYLKRNPDNQSLARGVDVLAPEGYGEIVGGGERETDQHLLREKITEHNLPMDAFEWYLDLRKYGSVTHSGFGLGLERLVAYVCKLPHVRETIPFPRMYGRLLP